MTGPEPLARVVVVAGPSGSGKSRLCRRLSQRLGLPVVNLDDFYRDGSDPALPRVDLGGGRTVVDWDDPRSWHRDEAVEALERLCTDGAVEAPVYDIAHDGRVGRRTVRLAGASYVLAEGIFAQEVVGPCRVRSLLADAVCVRNRRLVTFWRRLTRDLREHRKPPLVLLLRGLRLVREEPAVVAQAASRGCRPLSSEDAYRDLVRLVTAARTGSARVSGQE